MITRQDVIEYLKNLRASEIKEILSEISSIDYGFPSNSTQNFAAAYGCQSTVTENEWDFDVTLKSINIGASKVVVMKAIRDCMNISIAETKNIIDNLPCIIVHCICLEDAKEIKKRFDNVDAVVVRYSDSGRSVIL